MPSSRPIPKYVQRRVKNSVIYLSVLTALLALMAGLYQGGVHLTQLEASKVTLYELPSALTLSFLRMLISYIASIGFAFALGITAAKSKVGERLIIPALDILQSVPVVGFFPAAIAFFVGNGSGDRLGIEFAAIFLIFTSQAWNIAFAVYESVKGIPQNNTETLLSFGLSPIQRFFKLYLPACIPRVVYNSILSWSNGWFFLVACEIFSSGPLRFHLPGIGSFLARSAEENRIELVLGGLIALTAFILLLDYLVWRPASIWAERFRHDTSADSEEESIPFESLPRTILSWLSPVKKYARRLLRALLFPVVWILENLILPIFWELPLSLLRHFSYELYRLTWEKLLHSSPSAKENLQLATRILSGLIFAAFVLTLGYWGGKNLYQWLTPPWPDIIHEIPVAILASTGRLIIALGISLAWILPLVLYCWNRPRVRQRLTTIAQIGASLPAIALFPLFIVSIKEHFGMEAASTLLLCTGMQWYVLFNCLGGAASIPSDLKTLGRSYGLTAFQTWKSLVFPAIRPALITGALTAWGGGWNALVVAEYITFRGSTHQVAGIGALLNRAVFELDDSKAITLCLLAMVGWILLLNVIFWRPVYQYSLERYKIES